MVRFGPIFLNIRRRNDGPGGKRIMQMVRSRTLRLLVIAGCVPVITGAAQAATYNAFNGFSAASNPNGPWSYLYSASLPTTMPLPLGQAACNGIVGVACWQTGLGIPDFAVIGKNTTGGPLSFATIVFPTDKLYIDPESYTAILAFTAPAAGTYLIAGDFTGIDTGENSHPVQILDNGASIFSDTIGSYGQDDPFNLSETLNAGDTIELEVLTGSTGCFYCDLSTGLGATITGSPSSVVPEPGSLTLLGGALVAFAVARRRKTQTGTAG